MNQDQIILVLILVATVGMFLSGRWRHDMVALGALLACVFTGLVPTKEAFDGFGHPAVVTVACVLVLSHGLQTSGAVDALTRWVLPQTAGPMVTIASITGMAAVLSAFMNNVGALALLMPIAVQIARKQNLPPGKILMPLSFGSILGGMTTLIGTPPNLIVSGFRAEADGDSFAMFDFTPVGLAIAGVGAAFVALGGYRLVPARERAGAEGFETGAYLTEARVQAKAKADGMILREIEQALEESDATVVGLIRHERRIPAPNPMREVHADDILVIEAEPEGLASALSSLGLKLEEAVKQEKKEKNEKDKEAKEAEGDSEADGENPGGTKPPDERGDADEAKKEDAPRRAIVSDDIVLMELAVLPDSDFVGRSATSSNLRSRYGINLLAISRQGQRSTARLRTMPIRQGDVLLMQGSPESLTDFASTFGCVPLAERALRIPDKRKTIVASVVMVIAVCGAAFGLLPAAIAFATGVLASMALKVISPKAVYKMVDWPVIVLLAALIPVAGAMATTGAADLIANFLLEQIAQGNAVVALALILIVTMTLSDFMNNAATAAVMCPIAIGTAAQLEHNSDPFLMAVAVGASCAFLTPIGHQNNTLILGPGGFSFGDYWRLGLPLEIIVVTVGVPMILFVWPF